MHLVTYKFSNYKSFLQEAEFSFEALDNEYLSSNFFTVRLEDGSEKRLLKTAAVYGANASGKSNLLLPLKDLTAFIRNSRSFAVGKKIKFEPFRLGDGDKISDTQIEITFIIGDRLYRYEISYNADGFTYEALHRLYDDNEIMVFINRGGVVNASMEECGFGPEWFGDDQIWMENYLPNHLFLSEIATKPQNKLQEIYSAFEQIRVRSLGSFFSLHENTYRSAKDLIKSNQSELFYKLCKFMRLSDLGIAGIEMKSHSEEEFQFPEFISESIRRQMYERNRWEFRTIHKTKDGREVTFNLDEESSGTQNMFSLVALILDFLEKGGVLLYDEIDLLTHPHLFLLLILQVNFPMGNPHNAQLLFTTHNTIIVNETEGIMRADQIWFTQKNKYGESELYSAQDFEGVEIKVPFERWYRDGRFGALPSVDRLKSQPVIFRSDDDEKHIL